MAVSDSGSWKLIIYPLAFIIIIGSITTLIVRPFLDNGLTMDSQPTQFGETLIQLVETGNIQFNLTATESVIFFPFVAGAALTADIVSAILPQTLKDFVADSIRVYYYLPDPIQSIVTALLVISFVCIAYGIYVMGTMLIP